MSPAERAAALSALELLRARRADTAACAARFGAPFTALLVLDDRHVARLVELVGEAGDRAPSVGSCDEALAAACQRVLEADTRLTERLEELLSRTTHPALAVALQHVLGEGQAQRQALLGKHLRARAAHRCG